MLILLLLAANPTTTTVSSHVAMDAYCFSSSNTPNASGNPTTTTVGVHRGLDINCVGGCGGSSDGGSGLAAPGCATAQATGSDGGLLYCIPTLGQAYGGTGAGALTCSSGQALTSDGTAYSCTGSLAAGGSTPQAQWNSGGLLAGMSMVGSDSAHLRLATDVLYPVSDGGVVLFAQRPVTAFPSLPAYIDDFMGIPMPIGPRAVIFTPMGTTANWLFQGHMPDTWGASSIALNWGETTSSLGAVCSSNATNAWDGTTFKGKLRLVGCLGTTANFSVSEYRASWAHSTRGSIAASGGFVVWIRTYISSTNAKQRVFIGLVANVSALTGTPEPSTSADTVYAGCDNGSTNLNICSNDNSGSATCSDLGTNFPCKTSGVGYDVWLAAKPNGSAIAYDIQRLDSAQEATGSLSSDLPRNTLQLSAHSYMSTGDGGNVAVRQDFGGMEMLDNW